MKYIVTILLIVATNLCIGQIFSNDYGWGSRSEDTIVYNPRPVYLRDVAAYTIYNDTLLFGKTAFNPPFTVYVYETDETWMVFQIISYNKSLSWATEKILIQSGGVAQPQPIPDTITGHMIFIPDK